ncbi:hypothetical protein ACFP56_13185 [Paenibacillus septentrionalis]|uniref:DUF4367 domain-containing protein n=1 Tax=Paenibacillus septentrionalis TaxID=429342 RepID=A0ABW1V5T9_9BACL
MKEDQFEESMKHSLEKHTDSMLKHKEDIWKNIEEELFMTQPSRKTTHTKRKGGLGKRIGWIISVAAAASIIGVFTTTNTGQAFVEQIKQYFEPKKQVQEDIEGMPEEKEIVLQDTKSGYVIYIDEERYKLVEEANRDVIVTKEPLGDIYPEVSMSIEQAENEKPEDAAARLQQQLTEQYATVKEPESVTDPLTATMLSAIDGNEWDSPVERIYILSNERGGSFIITQKYFLEASEGHGARFHHMLKQFTIVEEEVEATQ